MAVAQRGEGEEVETEDTGQGGPGGSGRLGIKGGEGGPGEEQIILTNKQRNSRQYLTL